MKTILSLVGILSSVVVVGCSSLQLQPADFSWASEEVIDISANKTIDAKRYSVLFNVSAMLEKEFSGDIQVGSTTSIIRLIRDKAGFYFITAPNFKNVYVFKQGEGSLILTNTINISKDIGMPDPKFNQKDSYLELINGTQKIKLTFNGIQ